MKILVDTSVWVDFFNGHPSEEAAALERYLRAEADLATCGLVLAEFFQGLRDHRSVARLEPYFRDLALLSPREPDTYLAAADLFRGLRGKGFTVRSTVDCVIAQLAAEANALLLAKDRDMRLIARSGLCGVRMAPLLG